MELLRLAPEEVFPSLSYSPPPPSPSAPAWVHAAAARRDQVRPPAPHACQCSSLLALQPAQDCRLFAIAPCRPRPHELP